MDLSGTWNFELDRHDRGVGEGWFGRPLAETIELPGSLQAQGFGDPPGIASPWVGDLRNPDWHQDPRFAKYASPENFKFPFWLQPERVYVGPAWYQRALEIPAGWQDQRVTLTLERPHWSTRAWLDEVELRPCEAGLNESLSVPHRYELGLGLKPGTHRLTVRVDNRMWVNVGPNAHSMTDHTQGNWNGLAGDLRVEAGPPVYIADVQVFPDVAARSAWVVVRVASQLGQPGQASLTLQAWGGLSDTAHSLPALAGEIALDLEGGVAELVYPLGDQARTWDEFSAALYRLSVSLDATVARHAYTDHKEVSFGLREVGAAGTQLTINRRPIFLRGTLECSIFPLTGYPPTDAAAWRRILTIARSYGLNQLRFHSYCPPEAAFQAADEMGFYYQIECASWANQGASIGLGDPLDRWLYEEGRRITTAYGNHPSFVMMAYGNEPGGNIEDYLTDWVRYWKARDPRRVYTSGAGWPAIPDNDYHNIPAPRVQGWGEELRSRINALPPETLTDYTRYVTDLGKPIVSHEIGQWCVYPNFAEIEKYTGHLKARNFEIFRDSLVEHGMGDQAHDFLIASGKLQVLCYKEDIESALRTPGFGGFQLLDLHDFPGQGTALVGVLDPFWDDKGYVTGPEYARFCNAIVPLARLAKRYWRTDETLTAEIDIANFGPAALAGMIPAWRLVDDQGRRVAQGVLDAQTIPTGNTGPDGGPIRLGSIAIGLSDLAPARRYRLEVALPGVTNPNGSPVENDWDVWVFAAQVESAPPPDVLVTRSLDETAQARLAQGGKVLLLLAPETVKTSAVIGFSSVFWNTEWTGNQAPHTLGILVDPAHPLFAAFPTESHTNWQWWDLVHGAAAMQIDGLPVGLRPLVQPIDTWFENRRLALLFEARLGGGRLVVASMDLENDLAARPVARQLRRSLLDYMASAAFDPQVEVGAAEVGSLVTK